MDMSSIDRGCMQEVANLMAYSDLRYFRSVHLFMMGLVGFIPLNGFDYRNSIVWC